MFRRKKKGDASAEQGPSQPQSSAPAPPMGGFNLQVFDGRGHSGTMHFSRDSRGREVQRIQRNRQFKAHMPHTHK